MSQVLAEGATRQRKEGEKSLEKMVLGEFHEFLGVFNKECSERLPMHREYDLGIDLIDGVEVLAPGKLYQLAPAKLMVLHEFIDKNLAKGYIYQSSTPCSTLVFFVKKKDGSLQLVVDFWVLNVVIKLDAYPIPLTNKLLD